MRLIDADAMITNMLEEKRFVFQKEDLLRGTVVFETVYKDIAKFINSQPTAYDIDKVVEQLEENKLIVEIDDDHIVPESDVDEFFELEVVALSDAIEIVKGGAK